MIAPEPGSFATACPSCGGSSLQPFYRVDGVPVNSCILMESRERATTYPRGMMDLVLCQSCGFIYNRAFDPLAVVYDSAYEETQGFSARFQAFLRELAARLIERHALRDRTVLEIGCGKGEFLALLCELGKNSGVGIDPSYVPGRLTSPALERMTFIADTFGPSYSGIAADFVCCRHTLEHIAAVREFVALVRQSRPAAAGATVFFEVPDTGRVLREMAFWDVYYEHCSYFTAGSLAGLFERNGFAVSEVVKDFDEQYLLLTAGADAGGGSEVVPHDLEETARAIETFREGVSYRIAAWRDQLRSAVDRGMRPAIWGAGSKAVAYVQALGLGDELTALVDINPHKHGMYLPGSGHRVDGPDSLIQVRPDLVIAMNPVYRNEIQKMIRDMGLRADVVAV